MIDSTRQELLKLIEELSQHVPSIASDNWC